MAVRQILSQAVMQILLMMMMRIVRVEMVVMVAMIWMTTWREMKMKLKTLMGKWLGMKQTNPPHTQCLQ